MSARISPEMRCVHCSTTETPLWRAGPAGPKTLCNACGVRWKKTGSVIPRSKRPSTKTNSSTQTKQSTPALRKRQRTNPTSSHHSHPSQPLPPPPPPPPPSQPEQPRLNLPAPAPRPVSVFRISDASRSRYDSVFSGLMVVRKEPESGTRSRTRTQTTKGTALARDMNHAKEPSDDVAPCPSPPPVERDDKDAVYVTEVHAPSPSPSPPPMPRVQRLPEGGSFRLLLAAVADDKQST